MGFFSKKFSSKSTTHEETTIQPDVAHTAAESVPGATQERDVHDRLGKEIMLQDPKRVSQLSNFSDDSTDLNVSLEKSGAQVASDVEKPTHSEARHGQAEPTPSDNLSTLSKRDAEPKTALQAEEAEAEAEASADDEEGAKYPTGPKLAVIILALALAVFLMALDNTIIATAIPKITDQFHSLNDVGWYASSYLLTTCSLQLFYGKLYTFFSIKWVFLAAIVIFEIGSAVCGAAPSSQALIVGRAIAGLGSAGIFSGAFTIIAYTAPLEKRPTYMAIVGSVYGLASVIGPLMGGAFTDGPGWRWCFYINLPIGAVTLVIIFLTLHLRKRRLEAKVSMLERAKQLDLGGLFVFVGMIVSLLLALQWGGSTYAWNSWRIIVCFCVFAVLLVVFLGIQWYMGENATVPFRILKQRSIAAVSVWAFALGASFFILIYWVPIWFQAIKGVTALKSGIMTLPMVLALVLANIANGVGTTMIGYFNPFFFLSFVLSSIGSGLLTTWQVDVGANEWLGYQVIYGLGVGFGLQQSMICAQTVLPLKDVPVGTALVTFMQLLGGSVFVSAAQNLFNNRLMDLIPTYAPGVDPSIVVSTGATDLANQLPAQFLHGVQVAYNIALTQTWYIAVALCCLSAIPAFIVEWKSVKSAKPGAAVAGAA